MIIWIMVQGYMIVSGRSQEGIKGFIFNTGKSYLIIAVATGLAAGSGFSVRTLTDDLTSTVAQVVAGDEKAAKCLSADSAFLGCKIDRSLQVMQATMNFVGQLDTADDPILEDKKARAGWFVGIGSAGPALVAGTMLLLYKVMMAMFVAFGPLFILALLFKRTAPLFQKWLYYGVATIFSSMVLAVMTDISLDLIENVAATLFVADLLGINTGGVMQAATQQLGLGLLLSTLLLSVPPMAGSFFNGLMGSFSSIQNSMGSMAGSAMPAGGTANQAGFASALGENNAGKDASQTAQTTKGASSATGTSNIPNSQLGGGRVSTGQPSGIENSDVVKPAGNSSLGNASSGQPTATTTGAVSSDVSKPAAQPSQPSAPHWGTAQMAAPPSTASAETKQIQQQYAAGHGAPQAPSALPAQALSGTQTGTKSDVVKPNRS
jgi:type IV secretion system protein VirB6